MNMLCSAALIASFLTFTSLLWLVKETRELGLIFTTAGIIGSICSLELISSRGRKRHRLIKWITLLSFFAFLAFDVAIFTDAGNVKVATALVGLSLSPVFLCAYESAFRTTKVQGVGEVMSSSLINTSACVVSAF